MDLLELLFLSSALFCRLFAPFKTDPPMIMDNFEIVPVLGLNLPLFELRLILLLSLSESLLLSFYSLLILSLYEKLAYAILID